MTDEKTVRALNELGNVLQNQPSVRSGVMREVNQIALAPASAMTSAMTRVHRKWPALAGLAACVILAFGLIHLIGGDGASEAFAAAIDSVAKAHTFSCREIAQDVDEHGNVQTRETTYMFKEPDRSRQEMGAGWPNKGQITICDYGKKRQLTLIPSDKVADLQDTSSRYTVDASGELKPAQLYTAPRDQVLKLTAEAVKDLGTTQLNGKTVRVLQSTGKENVRTVYVDPKTNQPVQIVIQWPKFKNTKYTFADIQIDAPLDDRLFSLDVPQGYKLFRNGPYIPAPQYYSKMMTKMHHLDMVCTEYANDHRGEFPAKLSDLIGTDGMDEKVLNNLLASPDKPNGPPAILYRKPRPNKDSSAEIVLYEAPDQRRDGKVAVAMQDGHAEIVTQKKFDDLMK